MGFNVNIAGISPHNIFFHAFIEFLISYGISVLNRIQWTKIVIASLVFDVNVGVFIDRGHFYFLSLKSLRSLSVEETQLGVYGQFIIMALVFTGFSTSRIH